MRVLVGFPQPPTPEGSAPARCAVGLLRGLLAHGLDVTAVAARTSFAPGDDVPADLPVELVDVADPAPTVTARLRELIRPHGGLARSAFGERLRTLAGAADVVHLDQVETARCEVAAPAVVGLHYRLRLDQPLGAPWSAGFRDRAAFARAERAAVRSHRYLTASSPVVAADIRARHPAADVTVLPHTLDERAYDVAPLDGPPVAGVIGTAAWPPTRASFGRLVEVVWPAVRAEVPDAELVIAGRGTDALGLAGPGVRVAGTVPSSVGFLRSLSVLLYPIERGSGMKVKALEALACGVPVVTTPAGAEGIEASDGVVVCDRPADLARAAAALLRDEGERAERGRAARALFEERYTPRVATEPLVALYERMLDG